MEKKWRKIKQLFFQPNLTNNSTYPMRGSHLIMALEGLVGFIFFFVFARILEGSLTNHSLSVCLCLCVCVCVCVCCKWRSACTHQFHPFRPRISPQWLSNLRWLWTSVPLWVVCGPISLLSSYIVPGQHSQPTLTSLILVMMYAWVFFFFFCVCVCVFVLL